MGWGCLSTVSQLSRAGGVSRDNGTAGRILGDVVRKADFDMLTFDIDILTF